MDSVPNLTTAANPLPIAWFAEDPDAAATSPEAVCHAAIRYAESGLSTIPIDAFGDKSPDCQRVPAWKVYQLRRPRVDEILRWREVDGLFGLAAVGGIVTGRDAGGGLEIADFDSFQRAGPWRDTVGKRARGVFPRLPMVVSPRPGLHVYFRSPVCKGSCKLACAPVTDSQGQLIRDEHGRLKKTTLIECKGEASYVLCPPSPRRCHPRNELYRLLDGSPDLTQIPVISVEERGIMLEEARKFNRWIENKPVRNVRQVREVRGNGGRPGDEFNRTAQWEDILSKHGWVLVGRRGDVEDWQRPGKEGSGLSATVGYGGSELLYVFSSNAWPFEDGRAYDKFAGFALLEHDGDFRKAAQALLDEGYGRQGL